MKRKGDPIAPRKLTAAQVERGLAKDRAMLKADLAMAQEANAGGAQPLPGGGVRQMRIPISALVNGVQQHGPDLVATEAGQQELTEQARFYGLRKDGVSANGLRTRHGRATQIYRNGRWIKV